MKLYWWLLQTIHYNTHWSHHSKHCTVSQYMRQWDTNTPHISRFSSDWADIISLFRKCFMSGTLDCLVKGKTSKSFVIDQKKNIFLFVSEWIIYLRPPQAFHIQSLVITTLFFCFEAFTKLIIFALLKELGNLSFLFKNKYNL